MGKAAGIWKKLKKIGSEIGSKAAKAFAWLNTNLLQPFKPLISNAIDMVDETGIGSKIFDGVTDGYDNYLDKTGQKDVNSGVQDIFNFGNKIFEWTQNTDRFKKKHNVPPNYNMPFSPDKIVKRNDDYASGADLEW